MTENRSLLSTILVIVIVGLCFFWFRQIGPGDIGSPEIKNEDIIEHIKFLSDDKRAGRYPGTRQSKDVIAYIINQFKFDLIVLLDKYGYPPATHDEAYKSILEQAQNFQKTRS